MSAASMNPPHDVVVIGDGAAGAAAAVVLLRAAVASTWPAGTRVPTTYPFTSTGSAARPGSASSSAITGTARRALSSGPNGMDTGGAIHADLIVEDTRLPIAAQRSVAA